MNENNQTPNTPEVANPMPSAQPDEASKRAFAPQPEPKPAEAEENNKQKSEDAAEAAAKRGKKSEAAAPGAAASSQLEPGTDVFMSKMVFESFERKSSSVAALQTRLMELGYLTAGDDKHGWLSVGTKEALQKFASDKGIEAEKFLDEKVMKAVFANTKVNLLP